MIGLGSDKNNHEEVRILTRAGWFDWLEKQPNHHGWWTWWYILHHSVAAINYHHSSRSFVWRQLLKLIWGPSQLRNFAMRAICAAAIHYRGVSSYTLFFSVHVMIFSFSPFFAQKVMTSLKAAEICIILSISVCFVSALETPLCSFW